MKNRLRKSFQSNTVLVVDDEPIIRDILLDSFERYGAKVLCAENGQSAIEKFLSYKVDLVVSDIRMPGSDGLTLLSKIRALNGQTPVILVTGFADFTTALPLGASALFVKPFDPQILLVKAAELISIRNETELQNGR